MDNGEETVRAGNGQNFSLNISMLTNNLVLTSAAMVTPQLIEMLKITRIISAAPELPTIELNCKLHRINILDQPDSSILDALTETADLIDQETALDGRTLIFCVAGISRSATLCIGYLMKYYQLSLLEAYKYVKKCRPKIKPNCGFFKQLITFENELFLYNTVQMVYNEFVRMYIPDVYDCDYKIVRSRRKKV